MRTDIFAFGAVLYEMLTRPKGVRREEPGERHGGDPRAGAAASD